jgi:hypothetical protein
MPYGQEVDLCLDLSMIDPAALSFSAAQQFGLCVPFAE